MTIRQGVPRGTGWRLRIKGAGPSKPFSIKLLSNITRRLRPVWRSKDSLRHAGVKQDKQAEK